jgi:hypothetical protein
MPRYVSDVPTALRYDEAGGIINGYLMSEGFSYESVGGEMAWKKGVGAVTVPQFMKTLPGDGVVRIEAWVSKIAVIPGVYAGEQGLDGVWGWAVKSALRKRVQELERRLATAVPTGAVPSAVAESVSRPAAVPAAAQAAPGWYSDPTKRHQSRWWDGSAWTGNVADNGATSTDPV